MTGPAIGVIRHISKHDFFTSYINFNTARMTDRDTAAKILMMEFHQSLLELKEGI